MTDPVTSGTRIRERRVRAGMKQTELAHQAGISPSYLNLIEHNRRRIGGRTLLALAAALGVEPQVLTEGAAATLVAALREAAGLAEAAPPGADPDATPAHFRPDRPRARARPDRGVRRAISRLGGAAGRAASPHRGDGAHHRDADRPARA